MGLVQNKQINTAKQRFSKLLSAGVESRLLSEEMIDDTWYYLMEHDMLVLALLCFQFNIDHFADSVTLAGSYFYGFFRPKNKLASIHILIQIRALRLSKVVCFNWRQF